MQKLSKIIFYLVWSLTLAGCEEDPKVKLNRERAEQFPALYLKKYRNDATIVVKYENCVKGKDESLDRCLFSTTNNDLEKYVLNKYITERMDYVRTGDWDEKMEKEIKNPLPKEVKPTLPKATIDLQKYNLVLPKKSS
jgi:hypothetical protein